MGRRLLAYFSAQRIANLTVIAVVLYVVLWSLHPSLLLSGTTTTGGDMGAHVATPLYLHQHLFSAGLTPWYPGWFAGMPLYSYYFVLPDALASIASFVINYNVAFKLATILGSLLLPIGAYIMGKLFSARDPIPAALAAATLPFLFESTFTIDGGNLFSTLAGEYSYSLSLALALVAIGLFARGIRTGKGRWLAAAALSATLAAHFIPWIYALVVVAIVLVFELVDRRGLFDRERDTPRRRHGRRAVGFAVSAGAISLALSAWWLVPFATTQALTNPMGYTTDPTSTLRDIFTVPASTGGGLGWFNQAGGAAGSRWVIIGACLALVAAFMLRDRLGITLVSASVASLLGYALVPQGAIWNERLVPLWFISIYLSTGWLVGAVISRLSTIQPSSSAIELLAPEELAALPARRRVWGTFVVAGLAVVSTVPGMVSWLSPGLGVHPGSNQVSAWANWNYSGYEAKAAWPEYHTLMTTMSRVGARHGCGRAMWEYSDSENRFGTTMALMLLPYWTDGCVDSMEGLYFESSATTPYHFLNQAELSVHPSNPMVGLNYGSLDVALGVEHLQMLGVRYYIAFSPQIIEQARHVASLVPVATTAKFPGGVAWHIYLITDSPTVTPVANMPNVVAGISSRGAWLAANQNWWLNPSDWPVLLADSGPSTWPRVGSPERTVRVPAGTTTVSDVREGDVSISFTVSKVGVPVLVRTSYYPRWSVSGASGPYRVSPNLMVVVPTSQRVSLTYGASPAVTIGRWISLLALVGLAAAAWRARRWRRPARAS
jgi:hypothetical protein